MRNRRVVLAGVAVAAALLAGARSAHAARILVLPGSGENVSALLIYQAREILVRQLGSQNQVVDMSRPPTSQPVDPGKAMELGRSHGAVAALLLHIRHSDGATDFWVGVFDIEGGHQPLTIHERTSEGPAAIPTLMGRIVERLPFGSDASLAARGAASRPPRSPDDPHLDVGARMGMLVAIHDPARAFMNVPTIGASLLWHTRPVFGEMLAEYGKDGDNHIGSVGIGVYWGGLKLSDGVVYLGGSVRWASAQLGGMGATGAAAEPAIGLLWGTSHAVHLRAEAGYYVQAFPEKERDRLIVGWGVDRYTNGAQVSVGVSF